MFCIAGKVELPVPEQVVFFGLPISGVIITKLIFRYVLTPRCMVEGCGGLAKRNGNKSSAFRCRKCGNVYQANK